LWEAGEGHGLSAVLTTLFTVYFVGEGFGIMKGSQLGLQASLSKSLVNNDASC